MRNNSSSYEYEYCPLKEYIDKCKPLDARDFSSPTGDMYFFAKIFLQTAIPCGGAPDDEALLTWHMTKLSPD